MRDGWEDRPDGHTVPGPRGPCSLRVLLPLGPALPSEQKMQLFREGLDRQALGSTRPRPRAALRLIMPVPGLHLELEFTWRAVLDGAPGCALNKCQYPLTPSATSAQAFHAAVTLPPANVDPESHPHELTQHSVSTQVPSTDAEAEVGMRNAVCHWKIVTGRTVVEAEAPVLWPPDVKN